MEPVKIGVVISTEESPSPRRVDFVVTDGVVHQGQYVEIDSPQGRMLALVEDVIKTNRYFGQPEIVREYELRSSMEENFPVREWEFLVGVARPMIVYAPDGSKLRPTLPPSPGATVYSPPPDHLKDALGFADDGIHLGTLQFHDVPVVLDLSRLVQKHFAILAMSGAGKSYTTIVIIEELLDRRPEQGRIAVVVFDVHGEYVGFGEPVTGGDYEDYSDRTTVVDVRNVKIPVPELTAGDFNFLLPQMSGAQRRELEKVIASLRKDMEAGAGPYDLKDIIERAERDITHQGTRGALVSWLRNLESTGLFSAVESPPITRVVRPGRLVVFDLSKTVDSTVRQIVVSYFARRLFDLRRKNAIPPTLMIVEEAHNFVPSDTSRGDVPARPIIETIAREGRKFGLGLCLISQRPVKLSSTALSQCNTHIILRITNPYDLKHVEESSEGIDRRSADMITTLRPGEALIVGEAVEFPVFIKVRRRRSQKSKFEKNIVEMAKEFEQQLRDVEDVVEDL